MRRRRSRARRTRGPTSSTGFGIASSARPRASRPLHQSRPGPVWARRTCSRSASSCASLSCRAWCRGWSAASSSGTSRCVLSLIGLADAPARRIAQRSHRPSVQRRPQIFRLAARLARAWLADGLQPSAGLLSAPVAGGPDAQAGRLCLHAARLSARGQHVRPRAARLQQRQGLA